MSELELAADSLSIVVPGIYHPLAVSPDWLFEQSLIGDPEFDDRLVEMLLPGEATTFRVGTFRVLCQRDKLQVSTEDVSEYERLRDLVSGILRSLPNLKVSQLGINRHVHFHVPDVDSWNAIGDALVSNDIWGDVLPHSGMRAAIFWGHRLDKYAGRIQVQIEPSQKFPRAVFVAYNDHYELTTVGSQPSTREEWQEMPQITAAEALSEKKAVAVEILANNWRDSMHRFDQVLNRVAQQGRRAV